MKLRLSTIALGLALVTAVDAQPTLVTVYHSLPTSGESQHWFTSRESNTTSPLDMDGAGGLLWWRNVTGNYWLDQNHIAPGFGYLHILAASYNGSHGSSWFDRIGDRPYDLRGGRFSFEVQAAHNLTLSKDTRLIFWLQASEFAFATQFPGSPVSSDRFVNIGYLGNQTIDEALGYPPAETRSGAVSRTSDWVTYVVDFDPSKPTHWIAFGASQARSASYALPSTIDAFLSHWNWNLGIVAAYGHTAPPAYDPSQGHLRLRNLRLEVDATRNGL